MFFFVKSNGYNLFCGIVCAGKKKTRGSKRQFHELFFLKVMMKHGYIGEFEVVDDHRGGKIVVNLTGRLNKVGVISPRFDVGIKDIEKWTNNLLPSRQFG